MAELDLANIARPYAKAVFEIALKDNALDAWAGFLAAMALVAKDQSVRKLLTDPRLSREQKIQWLSDLAKEMQLGSASQLALLAILGENNRLITLSVLSDAFLEYKREHEKSALIQVKSAQPLSDVQQDQLKAALKKRYQRDIQLSVDVDHSLIGGVIIKAGDEVIDGSLRGQLNRLQTQLANSFQ